MEKKKEIVIENNVVVQKEVVMEKKCTNSDLKCQYHGKSLCLKWVHNCRWQPVGNYGRRKYCCKHKLVSSGKIKRKTKKECGFVGEIVSSSVISRCQIVKIGKDKKRKQCCKFIKKCHGSKCEESKKSCSFSGDVIIKGCSWQKKKVCIAPKLNSKTSKVYTCVSSGDPHYTTFSGTHFNNYASGDFVLFKSHEFIIHTRTKKWYSAAVNVNIAVKSKHTVVETISPSKYLINGRHYSIKSGKSRQTHDLLIERLSSTRTIIKNSLGDYVDISFFLKGNSKQNVNWPQTQFLNLIVSTSHTHDIHGLCVSQNEVEKGYGLFVKEYVPSSPSKPIKKFL